MNGKQRIFVRAGNPEEVTADDVRTLLQVLDTEERYRFAAFKKDTVKHQYLLSHVLLRLMLSDRFHVHPATHRFNRCNWQKPSLQGSGYLYDIDFNISHTDGSVACAIIDSGRVGIDLEYRARALDIDRLAPTCLTKQELNYINSGSDVERNDRFLRIWTLKEAYLKGRGIGLHLPLTDIQVDCSTLEKHEMHVSLTSAENDDSWRCRQFYPSSFHIGALAFKSNNAIEPSIDYSHISMETLRDSLKRLGDSSRRFTVCMKH